MAKEKSSHNNPKDTSKKGYDKKSVKTSKTRADNDDTGTSSTGAKKSKEGK